MVLAEIDLPSPVREEEQAVAKICYQQYTEMGGIIGEPDYNQAFEDAAKGTYLTKYHILQAQGMAEHYGIQLDSSEGNPDPRVRLYCALRGARKTKEEAEFHHCDMGDQILWRHTMMMLNLPEDVEKIITVDNKPLPNGLYQK